MYKFIIFLLLYSSHSFAGSFWFSVGNVTHNFESAQNDTTGGKKVFEFAPAVFLGARIPFIFDQNLAPAIGFAKFFTKDNSTKSEIILQYHLAQYLFGGLDFRYGLSNYITTIGGDGSTLTLNNGTGTATFYSPSESKKSYTTSLDIGANFLVSSDFSAGLQFSIMRFLSSERRRVSHILTVDYLF